LEAIRAYGARGVVGTAVPEELSGRGCDFVFWVAVRVPASGTRVVGDPIPPELREVFRVCLDHINDIATMRYGRLST